MSSLELALEDVARVYTGEPGCMCGCLGRYSDRPRDVARTLVEMIRAQRLGASLTIEVGVLSVRWLDRVLVVYRRVQRVA